MNKDNKDLIVDETLGLNTPNKDEQVINEEDFRVVKQLKDQEVIGVDDIPLDSKSNEFISLIKENVSFCVNELKDVDIAMNKISSQKNSELFFRKSESIKILSEYMSKMAVVNQKTLDLLVLLLGASGKMSDEYENIMNTIDELSELNNGEAEVLKYLLKVKNMVYEIRDNDTRLKKVLEDNAKTLEFIENADKDFKQEIKDSKKSRKTIESKCNKLQRKLTLNNIYIGICLLIIIGLCIFVGIKFYV